MGDSEAFWNSWYTVSDLKLRLEGGFNPPPPPPPVQYDVNTGWAVTWSNLLPSSSFFAVNKTVADRGCCWRMVAICSKYAADLFIDRVTFCTRKDGPSPNIRCRNAFGLIWSGLQRCKLPWHVWWQAVHTRMNTFAGNVSNAFKY